MPLLGVYLCIAADNKRTLLANPVFQNIGLWSYALYLAHWSLIVFFNKLGVQPHLWVLITAIFALGIALHFGIERRRNFGWKTCASYIGLSIALQIMISTKCFIEMPKVEDVNRNIVNTSQIQHFGDLNRPVDFILFGNSFARQYLNAIQEKPLHVVSIAYNAYLAFENAVNGADLTPDWREQCRLRYQNSIKAFNQYPNVPVIWDQDWDGYISQIFYDLNNAAIPDNFEQIFKQKLPIFSNVITEGNHKLFILSVARKKSAKLSVLFGQTCFA